MVINKGLRQLKVKAMDPGEGHDQTKQCLEGIFEMYLFSSLPMKNLPLA